MKAWKWVLGLVLGVLLGIVQKTWADFECGYGGEEGAAKPAATLAAPVGFYRSGTVRTLLIFGKLLGGV